MTRRAILALALALTAAPALAAPFSKNFKDWEVACDNLGDCAAFGFPPGERVGDVWIKLSIAAGADARPRLSGHAEGVDFAKARLIGVPPEFAALAPAEQLLAMAKKEEKASFASGAARATISLAGLAATLIAIDEAQGRLGTQAALIRKGARPAAAAPGPKPAPKLTPVPTKALGAGDARLARALAALQPKGFRDACPKQEETPGAGEVHRLGPGLDLVALECDSGAYNLMTRFWLVPCGDAKRARAIEWATPHGAPMASPEGGPETTLVNAAYDPAQGVLSFFQKARGLGDCGVAASYAWTGRGFALAEWSQMGECAGVPPEDWAPLWRTRR